VNVDVDSAILMILQG